MRIDKFLWCVRLFKTRSLASENVKGQKILINDELIKSSREIKEGQIVTLKKHGYDLKYKILGWPKSRVGAKLVDQYIENVTTQDNLEKKEFLEMARNVGRRKGMGRPTKKERRDLEDLLD